MNSPKNLLTFKRLDNSVQLFSLMKQETGILAVHECISVDRNCHVCVSYHGLVIPLLQWFRYKHNWTSTKFSLLENLVSYLRNKGAVLSEA